MNGKEKVTHEVLKCDKIEKTDCCHAQCKAAGKKVTKLSGEGKSTPEKMWRVKA